MRTPLLTLCVLGLLACPDPAKDKPKAAVAPAATPAPAPVKQALAEVAPLSNAVPFSFNQDGSKVAWVGAKVTAKHEGGFKTFKGVVEVVDQDLTKSRVRVDLDMASVFTDSEKLAGHLKSADFFAADDYPVARFVSTSFKKLEGTRVEVAGDLTLRGVTRSITFPADVTLGAEQLDVKAEFSINRKDFGIVYPGKPDNLIADNVLLSLDVHAKK